MVFGILKPDDSLGVRLKWSGLFWDIPGQVAAWLTSDSGGLMSDVPKD